MRNARAGSHDVVRMGRIWDASRFQRLFLRVSLGKFVAESLRGSQCQQKRERRKKANGNRHNDSREGKSVILGLDLAGSGCKTWHREMSCGFLGLQRPDDGRSIRKKAALEEESLYLLASVCRLHVANSPYHCSCRI